MVGGEPDHGTHGVYHLAMAAVKGCFLRSLGAMHTLLHITHNMFNSGGQVISRRSIGLSTQQLIHRQHNSLFRPIHHAKR